MAKTKAQILNEIEEDDTDLEYSTTEEDDESDPNFDILEETRSSLSKLSLKKSNSRIGKVKESDRKRKLDFEEVEMPPVFDEADEKSFEIVQKIIQGGQLEKLKVDQCKVYLRKYGLRLTGKKDILMERIREQLGIISGGGEQKYPISSFVMNCKGDACTGDVVMFEQTVYEKYNVASRSASGPPCGTRIVAGRIVKESYGAAKQQHTFTIEVLWSKGEQPFPPLHPLLIKGRNLYRLQTMRQKWDDEGERSRVLLEKHSRGSLARSSRESRIQEKESRKIFREQRGGRNMSCTNNKENQQQSLSNPVKSNFSQPPPILTHRPQNSIVPPVPNAKPSYYQPHVVQTQRPQNLVPSSIQPSRILTEINHQINLNLPQYPIKNQQYPTKPQMNSIPQQQTSRLWWNNANQVPQQYSSLPKSPLRGPMPQQVCNYYLQRRCTYGDSCKFLHDDSRRDESLNSRPQSPMRHYQGNNNQFHIINHPNGYANNQPASPTKQHCRHFAQFNRCRYGDNCKFLHVGRSEQRR